MSSLTLFCISTVLETDGKADDRVLGSQPSLPPHSSAGQKDTCQDVRITGYQAVSRHCQVCVTHIERALKIMLALVQADQYLFS